MKEKLLDLVMIVTLVMVVSQPVSPSYINTIQTHNLFSATATATVTNSITEGSLIGTGVGSMTIPANAMQVGNAYRIRLLGFHAAAASPSITVRIKMDGAAVATTGLVGTNNSTSQLFDVDVYVTVVTTGAGGTMFVQGYWKEWNTTGTANNFEMTTTSPTSVNTTLAHTFDIGFTWSAQSVSNIVTSTNVFMDQLR